jgi:amidase
MILLLIRLTLDISKLKIGLLKEGFDGVEEDVSTIVRDTALKLSELGAVVNDVTVPLHDDDILTYLLDS